jgi:GMP synthase-like glutamine amidotransferase
MRLLIVDPAMTAPETQGAREIARGWEGEVRVLQPCLRPGDGPCAGDGYDADAVVIMGSRASARDDHPWLRDLARWLAPLVDGSVERPLLGICFGHQLIARLAGGTVGFVHEDGRKESGFRDTELSGGRLLPGRHVLRVVASHFETVHALPRDYARTACRPHVAVDGFEHRTRPVFGWQFHPEAREGFALKCDLDPEGIDDQLRDDSRLILEAFRDFVLRKK